MSARRLYSVTGRLGNLYVRGAKLKGEIAEAVTGASLSLSSSEVTQLTLTVVDNGFDLLDSRLFDAGTPSARGSHVAYGNLNLECRAVEVGARGSDNVLTITARSVGASKLKRERGPLIRRGLSPTAFAALEAKGAGLRFVGQPSAERKAISRQTGDQPETSWDTCQRLAQELGYVCFEAADVLYFGKPTWLVGRAQTLRVTWKGRRTDDSIDALPTCRRTGDDPKNLATVEAALRGKLGEAALPGMALVLDGVPTFDGRYMVDAVALDLAEGAPVTVSASTPINPEPQPPEASGGGSAGSGHVSVPTPRAGLTVKGVKADAAQLGNATTIYRVGRGMGVPTFGLVVALAAAIQESVLRNLEGGDRDSVGLFQQRATWGSYAERHDPAAAARKFFTALRRVNGWTSLTVAAAAQAVQRSAYPSAYARWEHEARDLVDAITATIVHTTSSSSGSGGSSGGPKTAARFVAIALAQAGDRYVYGAEASASDANPNAFDCSELVQWAAARAGVAFVDGSSAQRAACHHISVATAIRTRGALLFHPGHVAISLGNGRTIEAANPGAGVVSYSAAGRFDAGGLIPGMRY